MEEPVWFQPSEGSAAFERLSDRRPGWLGATALVLLAFAIRVWGLADHSLWLDEAQLLVRAQSDLPTALMGRTPLDLAPPLYPLLLHLWTRLGEPDFLVRFPSVAASVLSVAVLTRLQPRPVGFVAALIYAVAPTQILYAQEATPYALVGLLASAALVAAQSVHPGQGACPRQVVKIRHGGPEAQRLRLFLSSLCLRASVVRLGGPVFRQASLSPVAWLVVLAVLSAYTYYGLAFLWFGLDLWLLACLARVYVASLRPPSPIRNTQYAVRITHHPLPPIRHVLLAHLAVALVCLPLLPLWWRQSQAGLDAWWGQYGSLEGWAGLTLFAQGALTHGLVFALLPFSQPPTWIPLALLGLVLLGGRRLGWIVGGGLMPLGLAYVAASLGRYPFEGRYLLFSAPALYAVLAAGLTRYSCPIPPSLLGKGVRGLGLSIALMLVAVLVTAWPVLGLEAPWAGHPPREELRPLLTLLEQRRLPDDAVYVGYGAAPAVAHYQRLGLAPSHAFLQSEWPAGRTGYQASQALAAAYGHPRLWLVMAHALPGEEQALAEALARRGAWLRERVATPGAALLLWDVGE